MYKISKKLGLAALLYIISSIFYVVFVQKYASVHTFKYPFTIPVFKALPDVIALYVCLTYLRGAIRFWMMGACIACATGDILLGISRYELPYKLALISYLIAHILFIVAFLKSSRFSFKRITGNILLVIYSVSIGIFVIPYCQHLSDKISVIFYIVVITSMAIVASHIKLKKSYIVIIGACLFVLSDSINAITKFVFSEEYDAAVNTQLHENSSKDTVGVRINISMVNSVPNGKTFYSVSLPLLTVIVSIYYLAMFLIVFGFVYILNQENNNREPIKHLSTAEPLDTIPLRTT